MPRKKTPTPPPSDLHPLPLHEFLPRVRACTLCAPFLPLGPRPVLQAGTRASILIASQAPGRKVHASGVPFDDASGERLRDWLELPPEVFYDEERVAIVPMGFCYPGKTASGDAPPRPECAPTWRAPLLELMPHIALTVAVGQYAIGWHLPGSRSRPLADTVRASAAADSPVIALPHPSPRNNGWLKHNPWFEADWLPVVRERIARALADFG